MRTGVWVFIVVFFVGSSFICSRGQPMDTTPSPSPCSGVLSSIFGCHRWDRFREAFGDDEESESGDMELVSPQEAEIYQQQLEDLISGRLGKSGGSSSETSSSSLFPALAPLPSNSPQSRETPPRPEVVSESTVQEPETAEEAVLEAKPARKFGPGEPVVEPDKEPSVETQSGEETSEKSTNSDHDHHLNRTVKTVCIVLAAVCLSVVVIGTALGLYFTYIHRSSDIDISLLD